MNQTAPRTIQDLLMALRGYWAAQGCVLAEPHDVEKGAGTMNPETFLRVLGPEPFRVAYVEPSRRPQDGRYGENPFRLEKHYQFQVILKPSPEQVVELYIESLRAFGIDPAHHDLRFEEDNWESPTLGAMGVGWQVLLDGMEITQFTYFQQAGGIELKSVPVELTYGTERILMFLTDTDDVFDLMWSSELSYAELRRQSEYEHSRHNFELADVELQRRLFDLYESEARRLLEAGAVLPAYDYVLKCSHAFNVLHARGAIGVSERAAYVARVRRLACRTAEAWVQGREEQGWPLTQRWSES